MIEQLRLAMIAGAGGFAGAAARYLLGIAVYRYLPGHFPYATFFINVSGCLAIGFLAVLADERFTLGPLARLFWMTGVLGGYTTFSTFGYETIVLLRQGNLVPAVVNVAGQVALGLAAFLAGAAAARTLS